jgi:response regulator RpfG family c-di-GMP phosphodiesterase
MLGAGALGKHHDGRARDVARCLAEWVNTHVALPKWLLTKVLIVEDEPQLRRPPGINLRSRRYHVDAVAGGTGALPTAATSLSDLVILDLPDMDGNEVVHGLRG